MIRLAARVGVVCGRESCAAPASKSVVRASGQPSHAFSCFGFSGYFEKLLNRNAERIRDLHQGPHRRISAPEFQIPQVAPLHCGTLCQLLLGPALRLAERSDALRQQPQDLGFGYGQPSSFRNGRYGFVRSELQSSDGVSTEVGALCIRKELQMAEPCGPGRPTIHTSWA